MRGDAEREPEEPGITWETQLMVTIHAGTHTYDAHTHTIMAHTHTQLWRTHTHTPDTLI